VKNIGKGESQFTLTQHNSMYCIVTFLHIQCDVDMLLGAYTIFRASCSNNTCNKQNIKPVQTFEPHLMNFCSIRNVCVWEVKTINLIFKRRIFNYSCLQNKILLNSRLIVYGEKYTTLTRTFRGYSAELLMLKQALRRAATAL
jgi:hypothetical protein